ncbi:MAG: DUF4870 domain-containing protein, partial [Leptolyngbya sp. SIO4C1]|nr:DUF4870 domain-containing protein [Leptolyngbya sp. SIO4C1]
MENTFDRDKRKIFTAVSHGSIFVSQLLFSAGIPLVLWFISEDPVVKDSAKEALNFHLNVWVYSLIFGLLTWVLIGWPLLGLLAIFQIVMPILAIAAALRQPDSVYRYP